MELGIGSCILVFLIYIFIDFLYALYTLYVTRLEPFKAANTSGVLYALLGLGVLSYVSNPWFLIPMALGAWVGTYFTVLWQKRNGQHT